MQHRDKVTLARVLLVVGVLAGLCLLVALVCYRQEVVAAIAGAIGLITNSWLSRLPPVQTPTGGLPPSDLSTIIDTLGRIEKNMVTKSQLDAAVAQAATDEQNLEQVIATAITDIKTAVAGEQPDFTDTLANLEALDGALKAVTANVQGQDPGPATAA